MSRPVLHDPDPQLRIKSEDVSIERILSPEMKLLIIELKETMRKENGVGIAAPQIGVHDRVIIVEMNGIATPFMNPVLSECSFRKINSEEGCLSVPGTWGMVTRYRSVTVRALDESGEEVVMKVQGFDATVFQHEIDHLDGILFIDRAEDIQKASRL